MQQWGLTIGRPWGAGYLAAAQMQAGDLDGAERTLAEAAAATAEIPEYGSWLPYLDSRAGLLLLRGELRACLEATLDCARRFEAFGGLNPAFMPWRSRAARCLAGLGEEREWATALAAEEVELARRWGEPGALGAALHAQALVQGHQDGEASLREALQVLEGSPARLEHARVLVALGATLRRQGRRSEARAPLRSGLDLARSCGATPLAERAYHELRATGASPRKLIRTGTDTLTAGERRVAQMAASGMSNKQIAQELFVTAKTVESHLAQSYRKLGISSRTELSSTLSQDRAEPYSS